MREHLIDFIGVREYFMEFLGAFFLLLAIGFTHDPLAIGLMVCAIVYIGGHISGAHYNPAVTLVFWMRKRISGFNAIKYVIAQLAGSTVACLLIYYTTGFPSILTPGPGVMPLIAILYEIIGTFILLSVVLTVVTTKKFEENHVYGVVFGLTVAAIAFTFGSISGGAFNPAVAFGQMIVDLMIGGDSMIYLYIYIIGPLLGATLSALLFRYFHPNS